MITVKIRSVTPRQYEFVEPEVQIEKLEDLPAKYEEIHALMNPSNKYSDSDFLDDLTLIVKNNLRIEGEGDLEKYEGFTDKQKLALKEIKNLIARAISKYKPEK